MRSYTKKFLTPITLVTTCALALSACSDSSSSSSTEAAEETTSQAPALNVELPGKPADFELTPPNTDLKFGETANVVISDYESRTLSYVKLTVNEPQTLTHEEAQENVGQEFAAEENLESYVCFPATFRVVHNEVLEEDPERSYQPMGDIELSAENKNGRRANMFIMGSSEICGVDGNAELPYDANDVNPDRDYQDAELSWKSTDGNGVNPEAVTFTYEVASIPELDREEKIRWMS